MLSNSRIVLVIAVDHFSDRTLSPYQDMWGTLELWLVCRVLYDESRLDIGHDLIRGMETAGLLEMRL